MGNVTATRTVPFTPATVWAAWADFGGIHRFHPFVKSSPLNGEQNDGVGASRICHFEDGNFVEEVVREWDEGQAMTVEIVAGSMPVTDAIAHITLTPAVGGTEVTMAMSYKAKMGVLGAVMDKLVMQSKFTGMLETVLAAQEAHLKSGELIGPDFKRTAA